MEVSEYIDDLSYSNLVDLIEGNEIKGADVLNSIAHEMEKTNEIIAKLERELQCTKNRKESLITGSQRVLQHLKKEYPLVVQRLGYIIVVTKDNISIERNVI